MNRPVDDDTFRASLSGLLCRIYDLEQAIRYQPDILRGIWYIMEEVVPKEKRDNWYAELMDKKDHR